MIYHPVDQDCGDELTLIVPKIIQIAFHAITPKAVVTASYPATAFTEYTGIVACLSIHAFCCFAITITPFGCCHRLLSKQRTRPQHDSGS